MKSTGESAEKNDIKVEPVRLHKETTFLKKLLNFFYEPSPTKIYN